MGFPLGPSCILQSIPSPPGIMIAAPPAAARRAITLRSSVKNGEI
jgi:hypothetical protein